MTRITSSPTRCLAIFVLALAAFSARAVEVRFVEVATDVYAFVGDTGPRTEENEALNANIGLVSTPAGAVLIDSGATELGARAIEAAAAKVTPQPIRWVINTGGQDHRWLGNDYFARRGATIVGHAAGRADMQARGGDQIAALSSLLGEKAAGTKARLPDRWIAGPMERLDIGGLAFELRYRGGGHTPGDMMVWLPQRSVAFTGDIVYIDRLLAVLPVSSTKAWLAAFDELEVLQPEKLVPGHGRVVSLDEARRQTRDYLLALRRHMKAAVEGNIDLGEAVGTFDGKGFAGLRMASDLMLGNANRVYLELERE